MTLSYFEKKALAVYPKKHIGLSARNFILAVAISLAITYYLRKTVFDSDIYQAPIPSIFECINNISFNSSPTLPSLPDFRPPLRAQGRRILDANGETTRLMSVNWYGASDIQYVPGGLSTRHRHDIAQLIRAMGFNSVRLPYSDEMVRSNPLISTEYVSANPDLVGSRALDVYSAVVSSLTDAGLFVVPNNHITQATWCCGANLCDAAWSNEWLGPICRFHQSEEGWIENWETIMRPLAQNSLVIGVDLRNEVRGPWGTMHWEKWASAAERAAERLLAINPNWLVIVEGISSANDLSGARRRPVQLSLAGRVVYSAHVYSWSGWGELHPYGRCGYIRFEKMMRKNWAYLLDEDIAPVWVGEIGTAGQPSKADMNYWSHLVRFLKEMDADWGYWAINARKPTKNEYESYGLVEDDWESVRWDHRMEDLCTLGLKGQLRVNDSQLDSGFG